jgi:hypothetical protein
MAAFLDWQSSLLATAFIVFSDGSEQHPGGYRRVGYGYAVYRAGHQLSTGYGAINGMSHVFDAEAIGA